MRVKAKLNIIGALLSVVQVCLLSLASVSPQIHSWAFHGCHSTDVVCSEAHSACTELPGVSDEHKTQSDASEDGADFCPVVLFEQGVTLGDESLIRIPKLHPIAETAVINPGVVFTDCFEDATRARAPPAG